MATDTIAINGTPIEDKHLIFTGGGPALNGLNRDREFVAMPGRAGGLLSSISTIDARVFRFEVETDFSVLTFAQRLSLLDQLRDLFEGSVELTFSTNPGRKIVGVCRVFEGSSFEPTFGNVSATIVVEVVCENAAFMDNEPTQLVLSTTPARVNVGTVGHDGRFYFTGPTTTPFTIVYRDAFGALWGQLNITPNLLTGERGIIDTASRQIVKVNTGDVRFLMPGWDNSSLWFHMLPRDCNRELGMMPTLEADASVMVEYRCNWEH